LTLLATSHAQVSPDQAPPGLNAPGALPAPVPRGAFLPPRLRSVIPSSAETARILDGLDDSPEARSVRSSTFGLWSGRDPRSCARVAQAESSDRCRRGSPRSAARGGSRGAGRERGVAHYGHAARRHANVLAGRGRRLPRTIGYELVARGVRERRCGP